MNANDHLEKFNQWLSKVKKLDTADSANIDERDLLVYKLQLLMEGEALSSQFCREVDHEEASTAHFRAVSRNIGKLAQPHFGENADEAFRVYNEDLLIQIPRLKTEIQNPINDVRKRVELALNTK